MRTTIRIKSAALPFICVFLILSLSGLGASSHDLEAAVLSKVQSIYREQGRINFSELYNSGEFSPGEKEYLGRLYEVFFAIPGFLLAERQSTGHLPTRNEIAQSFGIGPESVALLLSVMEKDPRVPRMFTRNKATGEIESIDRTAIDAFVKARGSNVKMTHWEGRPLPEFSLPELEGGTLSSGDLKGSPVVLYFWFSGCPPCARIAPILAELSRQYEPKGVKFVGLNADAVLGIGIDDSARRDSLAKEGIAFPVVKLDAATRSRFGQVNVFPTLFFADRDGVIRRHLVNFQDRETLEAIIKGLQ